MQWLTQSLTGGAGNLAAYLAAHVLLCLLPAFAIAGAMSALIPKSSITRWLGRRAPGRVSYPAAAAAGSLLAVCSCTIVPLFAGIYRKGAGLGPAMTFLFFAPAGNVLALAYTGSILGADFAVARVLLCLAFGIGIGLLMATIFRRDDAARDAQADTLFAGQAQIGAAAGGLLVALVAVLLAGTLKLPLLDRPLAAGDLPLPWVPAWQATLQAWVPFDPARGEEGVSVQGSLLIVLLLAIGAAAWQGLEDIVEGANRWTAVALGLVVATLVVAALRLRVHAGGVEVIATGRTVAVAAALAAAAACARRLDPASSRAWLWESWRFVKQIFGLLVAGVFVVGVIRQWIRPEWIQVLAGRNDLPANAVAVLFGVLDLGMHRGPLLAYLMADPELSLQSMLMIGAILGRAKTAVYVALVAGFSIGAGLLFGAWVDGASPWRIGLGLAIAGALLAAVRAWFGSRPAPAGAGSSNP